MYRNVKNYSFDELIGTAQWSDFVNYRRQMIDFYNSEEGCKMPIEQFSQQDDIVITKTEPETIKNQNKNEKYRKIDENDFYYNEKCHHKRAKPCNCHNKIHMGCCCLVKGEKGEPGPPGSIDYGYFTGEITSCSERNYGLVNFNSLRHTGIFDYSADDCAIRFRQSGLYKINYGIDRFQENIVLELYINNIPLNGSQNGFLIIETKKDSDLSIKALSETDTSNINGAKVYLLVEKI